MSRIERLTDSQIARFPEFVDRWTKISLCTDPADRPRAEAAIRDMYRRGGIKPPSTIVWCGSPLSQGLTHAFFVNRALTQSTGVTRTTVGAGVWASLESSVRASPEGGVGATMHDSVWSTVSDRVWSHVWSSMWSSVEDSVWDRVLNSVLAPVRDSVETSAWAMGASVRASVSADVWDSVGDTIRVSVEANGWEHPYGPNAPAWLAFYRYFHDVVGLTEQTEKLSGLWELAQSAGWALPHRDICWVSERHHVLSRDDDGLLHSLTGPACAYPDGWAIYAIHGVRVPQDVIERPQEIDVARIHNESNAEVRRIMIERYRHGEEINGAAAFLRDAGAERLDHEERYGTLWRHNIPGDEPIVMIEVVNATPEPDGSFKRYWLRVPPSAKTAREAVAWSFNMPAGEYAPEKET
jgi:hypothetical protein